MNQIEQTISSREVAEMIGMKEHSQMLKKIDKINEILNKSNLTCSDYWVESTYKQDGNGKPCREYQVTKLGCELIAHKTEGEKGVLFTVKYMKRFQEMEQVLTEKKPLSALEQISLHRDAILEVNEKVESVKSDLEEFKQDLPLLGCG